MDQQLPVGAFVSVRSTGYEGVILHERDAKHAGLIKVQYCNGTSYHCDRSELKIITNKRKCGLLREIFKKRMCPPSLKPGARVSLEFDGESTTGTVLKKKDPFYVGCIKIQYDDGTSYHCIPEDLEVLPQLQPGARVLVKPTGYEAVVQRKNDEDYEGLVKVTYDNGTFYHCDPSDLKMLSKERAPPLVLPSSLRPGARVLVKSRLATGVVLRKKNPCYAGRIKVKYDDGTSYHCDPTDLEVVISKRQRRAEEKRRAKNERAAKKRKLKDAQRRAERERDTERARRAEVQGFGHVCQRLSRVLQLRSSARGPSVDHPLLLRFQALRECLQQHLEQWGNRLRIVDLGPLQESVRTSRLALAHRQSAVRQAAARIRQGSEEANADRDIEGIILDRDRYKAAHLRTLKAALDSLLWALGMQMSGIPNAFKETQTEFAQAMRSKIKDRLESLKSADVKDTKSGETSLRQLVEDCALSAAEHVPQFGSQAAEIVPSGLLHDEGDWKKQTRPASVGLSPVKTKCWVHAVTNDVRWEKPTAAPNAVQYRIEDVLEAYQVWESRCTGVAAAAATDAALAAAQESLWRTPCLTPAATPEGVSVLVRLLEEANVAMEREVQVYKGTDKVALFPVHVVLQGAGSELAERRREKEALEQVLQALDQREEEISRLERFMDPVAARDSKVEALQSVRKLMDVETLQEDLEDAQIALQRAQRRGKAEERHFQAVLEAKKVLHRGKVTVHNALEEVLQLEVEFPEVVRYMEAGVPHELLPKWHAERTLADFDVEDRIISRNIVYRAQLDGKTYAVKAFRMGSRHTCMREAARLLRAAHPHVVELLAVFEEGPQSASFCIQMPWYSAGSLEVWIRDQQPNAVSVRQVLSQTCEAVGHLHSLGIVHCDIKPSNVLIGADGRARLADFDVAIDNTTRTSAVGAATQGFTAGFAAPELFHTGASPATDIYSLGATIAAVAADAAVPGAADASLLVQKLCSKDPKMRPKAFDTLGDPFFAPVFAWQRGQRRACCLMVHDSCQGEACQLETGLECGNPAHFMCADCLEGYVQNFLEDASSRQRMLHEGRIHCPMYPAECKNGPFSDWQLARTLPLNAFVRYTEARMRLLEEQLAQAKEQEVRAQVQVEIQRLAAMDEEQRKVLVAHRSITEQILNLRCPRLDCAHVFVDFTGCFALACSRCPCNFCGWCLADCGTDAHAHVRTCPQRPSGLNDPLFAKFCVFEEHHRRRRQQKVVQYLRSLESHLREKVATQIRRNLEDHGIDLSVVMKSI